MKTSSCKAKGRRLQQLVRDKLRELGTSFGLVDGDIESTGMGQSGVDVRLSPAALAVFPLDIECKNVENLNVPATFWEHFNKYVSRPTLKLLIHTKNFMPEPLVTMRLSDFLTMLRKLVTYERGTPTK